MNTSDSNVNTAIMQAHAMFAFTFLEDYRRSPVCITNAGHECLVTEPIITSLRSLPAPLFIQACITNAGHTYFVANPVSS